MCDYKNIIKALKLEPHPEGGYFSETHRSNVLLPKEGLPSYYSGPRPASTAIYYLLTEKEPISRLHKLKTDEIFHFYDGGPMEVLRLYEDGSGNIAVLGKDLDRGERPQIIIPRGTWFGALLMKRTKYTLIGCTVAPGFDFNDFTMNVLDKEKKYLKEKYIDFSDMIEALTLKK